jgi:aldehyde dehydrogenase (NAD+)
VSWEIIGAVFPKDEVAVVEGAADVATDLLARPFDHIFFTGSPAVGKKVMAAAAANLASVTLELGANRPSSWTPARTCAAPPSTSSGARW